MAIISGCPKEHEKASPVFWVTGLVPLSELLPSQLISRVHYSDPEKRGATLDYLVPMKYCLRSVEETSTPSCAEQALAISILGGALSTGAIYDTHTH